MKSTGNSMLFRKARQAYLARLRAERVGPDFSQRAIQALAHPGKVLKRAKTQCVLRGAGEDARLLFKFYTDRGLCARFRCSRARRAFAAAQTMRDLGLPMPEPLGYIEHSTAIAPFTSCLVMQFLSDAITVRQWLRENHHALTKSDWNSLRARIRELWLDLGRHGIYHDDTKTLNILLQPAADKEPRLYWIDPESVHPGKRPAKRQILRNLVQLNGSVRTWVPEEERLLFLREVAEVHPWLNAPSVEQKIRRWTRARLLNEIKTRCGP